MIMWIKWQNLAMPAHSLAARLPARLTTPRPRPRLTALAWPSLAVGGGVRACVRVALLCPFLSFSIKMDNFQPNKLSKRPVKTTYGIKPYNA